MKIMNKKTIFKAFALLSIAAFGMTSCGSKDKDAAAAADQKVQVKVAKAVSQMVPQTEVYTATVESDVKNSIAPNMSLRIKSILVDVGDVVGKGQVVAYLDATTETQLGMGLKSQEASLKSVQAQYENQKVETGRAAELYRMGGISKSEYDAAQLQLKVAEMNLEAAKAQLTSLKSQVSQSSENAKLVSPVSGVVTARNYDNGDMYSTGQPVLVIEQTNPVKLKINVSENYYKLLSKGMDVDVTLDAYEGEKFYGTVTIVYPTIDQSTHTFPVEITIKNSEQKVRPGMFARATVNFGGVKRVLVPDEALVKQIGAGDRYVYVCKNGKVSYNKVELGKHLGSQYEIISGVNAGDDVVIAGQNRLANGKEVEVVK